MKYFKILDYQSEKIITLFTTSDQLAIYLSVVDKFTNSFDVLSDDKKIITGRFIKDNEGNYSYRYEIVA